MTIFKMSLAVGLGVTGAVITLTGAYIFLDYKYRQHLIKDYLKKDS